MSPIPARADNGCDEWREKTVDSVDEHQKATHQTAQRAGVAEMLSATVPATTKGTLAAGYTHLHLETPWYGRAGRASPRL